MASCDEQDVERPDERAVLVVQGAVALDGTVSRQAIKQRLQKAAVAVMSEKLHTNELGDAISSVAR